MPASDCQNASGFDAASRGNFLDQLIKSAVNAKAADFYAITHDKCPDIIV